MNLYLVATEVEIQINTGDNTIDKTELKVIYLGHINAYFMWFEKDSYSTREKPMEFP